MTLTIHLTSEEESRLQIEARKNGLTPEECAREVLVTHLLAEAPEDRTLELFAAWEAEDATDDAGEIARRNQEWEEFRAGMNASRAAAGTAPLYP
jgi:hypothetical protein